MSQVPGPRSSQAEESPYIMARQWILNSQLGFEKSLEYQENVKVPTPDELGPNDVLVKIHAASLNYRELPIAGPIVRSPISKLEG